jgi:hypothetical protein
MAAFSTLFAGLGLAASLGSTAYGMMNSGGGSGQIAQISQMENAVRMRQVELDAERRKRDVIRQSQVATAQVENNAANAGGLNSSAVVGATSAISGQAGVNFQGIEQNLELARTLYTLGGARGQALWNNSRDQARRSGIMQLAGAFSKSSGTIGKLAQFGWGSMGGMFSGGGWNEDNDIQQVGYGT